MNAGYDLIKKAIAKERIIESIQIEGTVYEIRSPNLLTFTVLKDIEDEATSDGEQAEVNMALFVEMLYQDGKRVFANAEEARVLFEAPALLLTLQQAIRRVVEKQAEVFKAIQAPAGEVPAAPSGS